MSGEELKAKMKLLGISQAEIARRLNITTPSITAWFKYQSVSTKTLEDLCDICGVEIDFFYGGTKYLTTTNSSSKQQQVPRYLYEDLKKELIEAIRENEQLKNQISLMQQGLTIPEIAQKEVG